MTQFTNMLKRAWLALVLASAAGFAAAGPTYSVTLDTAFLGNQLARLDFAFESMAPAVFTQATLTNFNGDFGAEVQRLGDVVGDIPGTVVFTNTPGVNFLTQEIMTGGMLSFNVMFSGDYETVDSFNGSLFSVSIFDEFGDGFLFGDGAFASFSVTPISEDTPPGVTVTPDNRLVTIVAIPEPSELLLVLSGLALVGLVRRRRSK